MIGLWVRGLLSRRRGRLLGCTAGVAVAVALLAALGSFVAAAEATMTARAVQGIAVDWQIDVQPGTSAANVLAAARAAPGDLAALPVGFAATTGLRSTGATTQATGPGQVLGLPPGYRTTFPGEIRTLVGSDAGVLISQQTAANLHVKPGDTITIGRAGMSPFHVKVDGVVELPQADSLFQKVGAPSTAQPTAPPDNVVLLPAPVFQQAFTALAKTRPDLVRTQIHVQRSHDLAPAPSTAYTDALGAAQNFEASVTGAGVVGNNLAAALGAAREDALYSRLLFLFLGAPGAVLAALVTAAVASSGAVRRRRELALLRTRGGSSRRILGLSLVEAAVIGVLGVAAGLAGAALIGRLAFGSTSFGATPTATAVWVGGAVLIGFAVAFATVAIPVRRDLRGSTAREGMASVRRTESPRWMSWGLDLLVLAASLLAFYAAGRNKYTLVLAPEGVPTVSVDYWALLGPALLWVAAGLLAWRAADAVLRFGGAGLRRILRPVSGSLTWPLTASMRRQRRLLSRSVVLLALAISFAASTAIFNATYQQQAEADAQLTNGADVAVTEPPGSSVGPGAASQIASVSGVRAVQPLQHRYAYVGADLQDLYGIDPQTLPTATTLQDAYFQGGTASQLLAALAARPDALLVSAETVVDFQLQPDDPITLRVRNSSGALVKVPFHYAGIVNEFPTAPKDSFLVANASYLTQRTGSNAVGTFLVDTASGNEHQVGVALQQRLGTSAHVTDITTTRGVVASSLTAVDLSGLTRVELGFAVVLVGAASGLVLALSWTERRRSFALLSALGGRPSQLRGFIAGESVVITGLGLAAGVAGGWALSLMLVKVLTGVFDPPPAQLAVPWPYLLLLLGSLVVSALAAATVAVAMSAQPPTSELRSL